MRTEKEKLWKLPWLLLRYFSWTLSDRALSALRLRRPAENSFLSPRSGLRKQHLPALPLLLTPARVCFQVSSSRWPSGHSSGQSTSGSSGQSDPGSFSPVEALLDKVPSSTASSIMRIVDERLFFAIGGLSDQSESPEGTLLS